MLSVKEIDKLLDEVIAREGGYVNHPQDPGGETKYGISKRSYPEEDIPALTVERAKELYRRDFVRRFRIDEFSNIETARLVLDWVVHSGALGIRKIQHHLGITSDGVVGPQTLAALESVEPRDILRWRLFFFISLTGHPFIKGWVNRLVELGL